MNLTDPLGTACGGFATYRLTIGMYDSMLSQLSRKFLNSLDPDLWLQDGRLGQSLRWSLHQSLLESYELVR